VDRVTIYGCDVSEYQPNYEPASNEDFMIIKATLGMSIVDPERNDHADTARSKGLVTGWYHFLWPSHSSGTGAEQARYFLDHIPDLRDGEILVCDWESNNDGLPSESDRDNFVKECRNKAPGHKVLLYCNASTFNGSDKERFDGLWVAHYTSASEPGVDDWLVWQYTDNPYDKNRAKFDSRDDMRAWAGGGGGGGNTSNGVLGLTKIEKHHYGA